MKPNELNPFLRRGAVHTLEPHWVTPLRVLFDYMLLYVERGSSTLIFNKESYSLNAGDTILIPPGISFSIRGSGMASIFPHIHFDICWDNYSDSRYISFLDLSQMSTLERRMIAPNVFAAYPMQPFLTFKNPGRMKELLYGFTAEDPPTFTAEKKARLTELIGTVIEDNFPDLLEPTVPEGASIAHAIRNFLDAYFSSNITLKDLEAQFYYDKFYLESQFRRQYGMPIMSYRKKKRMEIGADLLRHNSVSRVADKVGYGSVFAFCKAFKQYHGMTPTEYVQTKYRSSGEQAEKPQKN